MTKPRLSHIGFFYNTEFPRNQASAYTRGETDVRDALNHKTVYHYTGDDLLTKIERYTGRERYTKYCSDRFYWGKDSDEGDLVCKALLEADDSIRSCRYLQYDGKHNVTAEYLLGNISGTSFIKPNLNSEGVPRENGCERYTIHRTYSNNPFKLLLSETFPN